MDRSITGENGKLYVFFEASGLTLAAAHEGIREVIPYTREVPVPQTPAYIAGVINYGGRVCPVISINNAEVFKGSASSGRRRIIMFESPENSSILIGLHADYFLGSGHVKSSEINAFDGKDAGFNAGCIGGRTRLKDAYALIFLPFAFFKKLDYLCLK